MSTLLDYLALLADKNEDQLRFALARVISQHQPKDVTLEDEDNNYCWACSWQVVDPHAELDPWPCGTIQGIWAWLELGGHYDAIPMGVPDDDPNAE